MKMLGNYPAFKSLEVEQVSSATSSPGLLGRAHIFLSGSTDGIYRNSSRDLSACSPWNDQACLN